MDGLAAGDSHLAIDHRAFRNGYAAGHNVCLNHCSRAYFELLLDNQLAGYTARDDRGLCVDLAFPVRAHSHVQRTAHSAVAPDGPADDQWASSFDVTGQVTSFGHKCW